ncbi:helix-turn-helix transcriptional regulator [Ureibacillus thermosphaericus]|uniref:helix-turn-helix domain-containing protein n=1 Tax=Ureibacillus thermosphaericus TaxID=51173 RepID=UPI0030C91FB1
MNTLGQIVNEARLKKQMTLKELAEKTELTDTYLSFIENNKRNPSKKVLMKLSKVLDINLSTLLAASLKFKEQKEQAKIKKALEEFNAFNENVELHRTLANTHFKLENFLKQNENIYFKNIRLSENDKKRILKMLDILFEHFEELEPNYPTIEEFKKILKKQKEKELIEEKRHFLLELLEAGEITKEEYENFDLDDIKFFD